MSDNETVKERFIRGLGKNYISKEKHKKMQDDIRTGRKLRKLVETMKKEEQCGRMRTKV